MPDVGLKGFLVISVALHGALFGAAVFFQNQSGFTKAEPIKVGVISKYKDPGVRKGSAVELPANKSSVRNNPEPEIKKAVVQKQTPVNEKKIVKPVAEKKDPPRDKPVVTRKVEESVPEQTSEQTSEIVSNENTEPTGIEDAETSGKTLGAAAEGLGLGSEGQGRGVEVGYAAYNLNPKPNYPMVARRNGYEGIVLLKVLVLADGTAGKVQLEKSSGYGVLDKSAIEAVREWIFIPGKRNDEPIASWVTVPIRFQLSSG